MTPICKKLAGANGRGRFRASEVVSKDSKMELYSQVSISTYLFFTSKMMSGHVFLVGIPLSQNQRVPGTQVGTQVWKSSDQTSTFQVSSSFVPGSGCLAFRVTLVARRLPWWLEGYQLGKMYHAWSTGAPPERVYPPQKQGCNKALIKGNQWSVLN